MVLTRYPSLDSIMAFLLCLNNENGVSGASIAEKVNFSVSNVEVITRVLRPTGLIESFKGPNGGHMLTKELNEITVGELIPAVSPKNKILIEMMALLSSTKIIHFRKLDNNNLI